MSIDNGNWIVNRKDCNNLSISKDLFVGDRIDNIENIVVEKNDFIRFPEFFSIKAERAWWDKQREYF